MAFQEQAMQFCEHITALTGVYSTLLDVEQKRFLKPPYRQGCGLNNAACYAEALHSKNCREAARWNGHYLYRCPCGLTYIAAVLRPRGTDAVYGMVNGPFVLVDEKNHPVQNGLQAEQIQSVPWLTRKQAKALSETASALCGYLEGAHALSAADHGVQRDVLYSMSMSLPMQEHGSYPIEEERRLQQLIRSGDRKQASQLLNSLLLELYLSGGNNLIALKQRIRELITLMSRASVDGGADVRQIFQLCDRSVAELEMLCNFDELDAWLGRVLHRFFDLLFACGSGKHTNLVRRASCYIQDHMAEKLSLDDVAKHVHLSKSYFCRVLKEEVGTTFTEYTNQLRVERSKAYLHQGGMSLAEIAGVVGFDDQSYFTRIFKRYVGMPPGQYRANSLGA